MMGEFQSDKKPLTNAHPVSHHFAKKAMHPVQKMEENVRTFESGFRSLIGSNYDMNT